MTSPRIVADFGGTGIQGSSVVEASLKDGTFVPRAISRGPDSEASRNLKARGIEVVKADSLDKTSLVTVPVFFLPSPKGKGELVQGKNMVDAAKEVGVKFFIWMISARGSSLPSITKLSGGKYKNVLHYDEKAEVQEYLAASGLNHASLLLPTFLEIFWTRPLLVKTDTGYDVAVINFKPTEVMCFSWIKSIRTRRTLHGWGVRLY
ncbi:hypothetical protein FB451DRAFT_1181984 [Mycena latifolia]|nr:hypothetical protein FB451DRAFT_1181984 [Mycena latifolia]